MILKIAAGNGFTIYDNLERVHYELSAMQRVRAVMGMKEGEPPVQFEMREEENPDVWNEISPDAMWVNNNFPQEGKKYVHCAFTLDRYGKEQLFVFETGYLCNDQGDTLEIIR